MLSRSATSASARRPFWTGPPWRGPWRGAAHRSSGRTWLDRRETVCHPCPLGEGEACRVARAGLGGREATAFATSNEEAFDRDFRAVPSERPALPSEGTLHYSARAGPKPRRARGDDRRHGVVGPGALFSLHAETLDVPRLPLDKLSGPRLRRGRARHRRFARARSRTLRAAPDACIGERVNSGKRDGCSDVLSKAFGVRIGRSPRWCGV